ncbi:MAG: ClpXP protease specificity-enhancing factor [Gammaproteobacteria bacterium]|nr:ClpXP protease specificity-enhancing factor [Gammaproteobacteria bacterium]
MTSTRPYLLRALNEWILDNHLTPHMLVDATVSGAVVPQEQVEDGRIVFNVSPAAVRGLEISNAAVTFQARFAGRPLGVWIPIQAVLAIYAKENGKGMAFHVDEPADDGGGRPTPTQKPALKIVK